MQLPDINGSEATLRLVEALKPDVGCSDVQIPGLPGGSVPGHEALAMGAIATGRIRVLHSEVIEELDISEADIERVAVREQQELQHHDRVYRGDQPLPDMQGRCVILADHGLATGKRCVRISWPNDL